MHQRSRNRQSFDVKKSSKSIVRTRSSQHEQTHQAAAKSKRNNRGYETIHCAIRYLSAAMIGAITMHVCTFSYYYESGPSNRDPPLPFLPRTDDITTEKNLSRTDVGYENTTTEENSVTVRKTKTAVWGIPERLFTVVGLESSGTTFMSKTLAEALSLHVKLKDNGHETVAIGRTSLYSHDDGDDGSTKKFITEVQHVSLPWGGNCNDQEPRKDVIPVVYPRNCMAALRQRNQRHGSRVFMTAGVKRCWDLLDNTAKNDPQYPPGRYFLNLTSHFEWYRQRGTDVHLVIIVRDKSISRQARAKHCPNPAYVEKEEEVGMQSINHAIDHYVLKNNNQEKKVVDPSKNVMASADGKVVVVSYEMLNFFRDRYLQQIYNYLGIDSSFNPEWEDGNTKYVNGSKNRDNFGTENVSDLKEKNRDNFFGLGFEGKKGMEFKHE